MAPERTTYNGPALSGAGIFCSTSKIIKPEQLSDATYNKWYNEVHVPDVLATGGVSAAFRFKNANPNADRKYMALYLVPDLAVVQSEKFRAIPMTSDLMPNGGSCHEFIDFDTRFYKLEQDYNIKNVKETDFFPIVLLAGMEAKDGYADDLDAWYREEHLEQMSREPGYQRARRYKLVFQVKTKDRPTSIEATSGLTLYDFDESAKEHLGMDVKPLDPMTDWTKRCIANSKSIEAGIYYRLGAFK